jgi:Rrf2 family nitric oxide-sensitive transcriptional repressor
MISNTSEYALRALVALADTPGGSAVQARELAQVTKVPPSYLYKILTTLRRAGVLAGSRGSHGGYQLARDASEIPLIDVVSMFEEVRPNDACLLGEFDQCDDDRPCTAHRHWKHVQQTYNNFLKATTIADLSTKNLPDPE